MYDQEPLWVERMPMAGLVAVLIPAFAVFLVVVQLHGGFAPQYMFPLALATVFGLRGAVMTVVVFPGHLVVRNYRKTHRIRRSRIRGFEIVTSPINSRCPTVAVLTTAEAVPIDLMTAGFGRRSEAKLAARAERLRAWLASAPD